MNLHKRFLYLFGYLFLGYLLFILVMFVFDRRHVNLLWQNEVGRLKKVFDSFLDLVSQNLREYTSDYTYWDEMVEFVKTGDLKWAEQNLVASLDTYRADFVSVYDLEANLIYFYTNKEKLKDKNPLEGFDKKRIEEIFKGGPLNNFFLKTKCGLFEISSATIHPTADFKRKTPPQGYFFCGRLWDEEYIRRLSQLIGINIFIKYPQEIESMFLPSKQTTVQFSYELSDYRGEPVAWLYGLTESKILEHFYQIVKRQLYFINIFFFILFTIIAITTKCWIENPISLLIQAVKHRDVNYLKRIEKSAEDMKLLKKAVEETLDYEDALHNEIELRKSTEEKLKKLNRLLTILSDVNQIIVHTTDREKLFIDICRVIVEKGLYRMAWIGLVDKETKLVRPVSWWGYVDGYLDNIRISIDGSIPEGRCPTGNAIREGKYFICNDIEKASYMQSWKEEALKRNYRSVASFPLRLKSAVIGTLNIYAENINFFEDQEIKLLDELANDVSFAIEYLDKEEKRKQQEKNLQSAYEQLKLLQSQLIQSAKLASLGQLSAGVAHEINNPLVGVLNNVQLLKMMLEQQKEISSQELKEIISSIEESGLRCKKIVQNMLSFSRTSQQAFENLSLNDIIQHTCSLIGTEYKLQNVNIELKLKEDLPSILGDRQLLQQMLLDFLNNALWAIKKKSETQPGTITIETNYDSNNKKIILTISDTGIGIPEENLSRIFEPFFTTKEVGEGTGLGLAIVYNIITRHQGEVEVKSKVGEGTTFIVRFPPQADLI